MESLEQVLTKGLKEDMVNYISTHSGAFKQLIPFALSKSSRASVRATWMIGHFMEPKDQRLQKDIQKFVKLIPESKDGHQRELLKVLLKMEIPEESEGILFDTCVSIWTDLGKIPSVRYYAFLFILQMGKKYPDLKHEIKMLAEEEYIESLSSGIKKSIRKQLGILGK